MNMRRKRHRRRFSLLPLTFFAVASVLIFQGVWARRGLRDLLLLRRECARLERERATLIAENARLRREIEKLSSDELYLRRLVHRELGFVANDEILLRFDSRK